MVYSDGLQGTTVTAVIVRSFISSVKHSEKDRHESLQQLYMTGGQGGIPGMAWMWHFLAAFSR